MGTSQFAPQARLTVAALLAAGLLLQACGGGATKEAVGENAGAGNPRYGGRTWGVQLASASPATCTNEVLAPVTIQAVGVDRATGAAIPLDAFSWLVEADTTYHHLPGTPAIPGQDLSVSFHVSYSPPVASGRKNAGDPDPLLQLPACGWYFVSILPRQVPNGSNGGYELSGMPIPARPTGAPYTVTVRTNKLPKPTGSLSVFAFEDTAPINNAPDLPREHGLAGFTVYLIEAGGTYGDAGGIMTQDAFGNRLGTEYVTQLDPASGQQVATLDANGNPIVKTPGKGYLTTDQNGEAIFRHLSQAKYSIQMLPPPGSGWHQTATIEGTRTIDAWIKPGEPSVFVEFGPPGHHVFMGFVKEFQALPAGAQTTTLTGQVVSLHTSRPPDYAMYAGGPIKGAWVGLNAVTNGVGTGVYAGPAHPETGRFSIAGVPPGQYQVVIWDENLDVIFAGHNVTVPAAPPATTDLASIPVFKWFTQMDVIPFSDANGNGFRDPGEPALPDVGVIHRFRDGSIYKAAASDASGVAHFEELFPFFNWMVVEVDVGRNAVTGATIWVDDGGPIDPNDPNGFGVLHPQPQADGGPYRIEPGAGAEAYQGFINQSSRIEWGLTPHQPGENGGISGIVSYDTTRAEDDPAYGTQEEWQPGVPRVQMVLYADDPANPGQILGAAGSGGVVCLADVDNWPFGWAKGTAAQGPEDLKRDTCAQANPGAWSKGDAIDVTWTTGFDDQRPTGCRWPNDVPFSMNGVPTDCFDGMRAFNQVRPGTYDGGWGFGTNNPRFAPEMPVNPDWPPPFVEFIPAGAYVVEMIPPPAYQVVKEEDRNVVFGDTWTPQPLPAKLPPACVGDLHTVPAFLALFPDGEFPTPYAGQPRPLCDRKRITINDGENAAADFFVFTEVPVAGHIQGMVLDDLTNEFDVLSPTFGEKYSPPHIPVSVRDWSGQEITRVYTDEYGMFNALVPSTFNINPPYASGVGPSILTACINSPGPIPDPAAPGQLVIDPWFSRKYSQFCYQLQYMPGKTTYLDTPVVSIAAFTGSQQATLDCEQVDGTPMIHSATGPSLPGPYLARGQTLTIVSRGRMDVPNPAFVPHLSPATTLPTSSRDYGFGAQPGRVFLDLFNAAGARAERIPLPVNAGAWTPDGVAVTIPAGLAATITHGELTLVRGDNGRATPLGVTVHIAGPGQPAPKVVPPGATIQSVIDAPTTVAGDIVLVPPGLYEELVILDKPVRLQGAGPGATVINAAKVPAEKLTAWRRSVLARVTASPDLLLTGQTTALPAGEPFVEPALLATEEGPGVLVLAHGGGPLSGRVQPPASTRAEGNTRIDGFFITGGDSGGAIFVNGHAHGLRVTNNQITGNQGFYGGGIRLGHPTLTTTNANGIPSYVNADNADILVGRNMVTMNGALAGAGGGVSIHGGAARYRVIENFVCGNYTVGDGGGIGHLGLSNAGRIDRNTILFNQSFDQGTSRNGGGLLIAGQPPLVVGGLTAGSGSVIVDRNFILGNQAGAGDGGGLRLQSVNGAEATCAALGCLGAWRVVITNNVISNNVAGQAGGAISLQDVAGNGDWSPSWGSAIVNNTLDLNDSTATAGDAFAAGNPNQSTAQVSGIVAYPNSPALAAKLAAVTVAAVRPSPFSNPDLRNNVLRNSRSFFFTATSTAGQLPTFTEVLSGAPGSQDLGVVGGGLLNPRRGVLTTAYAGGSGNVTADPLLAAEYPNVAAPTLILNEWTAAQGFGLSIQVTPAFDEGGNFIDARFAPLTLVQPGGALYRDFHVPEASSANRQGSAQALLLYPQTAFDIEGNRRLPSGSILDLRIDAGAYRTPTQP